MNFCYLDLEEIDLTVDLIINSVVAETLFRLCIKIDGFDVLYQMPIGSPKLFDLSNKILLSGLLAIAGNQWIYFGAAVLGVIRNR